MASMRTILSVALSRLRTVLDKGTGYVRAALDPNPDDAKYRAEEGVHVVVGDPEPYLPSGAGRWGYKVRRSMWVYVVTRCNKDPGGRDDIAMFEHLDLQDKVIDAVHDLHPDHQSTDLWPATIGVKWAPGGAGMRRATKTDVGYISSALAFEVTYQQPFTTPTA